MCSVCERERTFKRGNWLGGWVGVGEERDREWTFEEREVMNKSNRKTRI